MARQYPFRNVNDKSVVLVDFDRMMEMDAQGFLKIRGKQYRRARDLESQPVVTPAEPEARLDRVSDSLGFVVDCLPDMQTNLLESKVQGIEFKEDPHVPNFYQVHASSQGAMTKYMLSRKYHDKNSLNGSGAILGEKDFKDARELVNRGRGERTEHHSLET